MLFTTLLSRVLSSPEEGADGGGSAGSGGAAPGGTPAPAGGSGGLTQEQVNRIVQERLERERATFNKQLEEYGIQGGVAGLQAQREKERKTAEEAAKAKGEYEGLYKAEQQRRAELEAKLNELTEREKRASIESTMARAAADSIAPQQVAQLVSATLASQGQSVVVRDGIPMVVDATGMPITDGQGGLLTAESAIQRFLTENPHFQKATASGAGAGSAPGPRPPAKVQPGGAGQFVGRGDTKYIMENRDAIREAMARGEIS